MCILISTTEIPDYPFVLLSNRDEFFARPTQLAQFRQGPNGTEFLSPMDLGRPEHGSWIGVSKSGKIAVLVNYREESMIWGSVSRGILPIDYLTSNVPDDEWYYTLEDRLSKRANRPTKLADVGGFTLLYGQLKLDKNGKLEPLNIISNRGDRGKVHVSEMSSALAHEATATQKTFGLSNSLFYEPWEKVALGQEMVSNLVKQTSGFSPSQLAEACFKVLSHNTYSEEISQNGTFNEIMYELRNTIYVPPLDTKQPSNVGSNMGRFYGTRTQTVILLHKSGTLHYFERDLFSNDLDDKNVRSQHREFSLWKPE